MLKSFNNGVIMGKSCAKCSIVLGNGVNIKKMK